MTPNAGDPSFNNDFVTDQENKMESSSPVKISNGKYALKIVSNTLNIIAYLLIGATVGVSLMFALSYDMPLGPTPTHLILCVLGYHVLMAVAILSLAPDHGWSAFLSLRDKRRAHTILQVAGSALAIVGSFIKILDKNINWNTLHGQFGLVALVFTTVSLVNGLTSLYAFEWRRWLPGNLSKLTHICFGIVAFAASSISLCYGFDKGLFRNWATHTYTDALIAFTAIFTFIVILNPIITFFSKSINIIKK